MIKRLRIKKIMQMTRKTRIMIITLIVGMKSARGKITWGDYIIWNTTTCYLTSCTLLIPTVNVIIIILVFLVICINLFIRNLLIICIIDVIRSIRNIIFSRLFYSYHIGLIIFLVLITYIAYIAIDMNVFNYYPFVLEWRHSSTPCRCWWSGGSR